MKSAKKAMLALGLMVLATMAQAETLGDVSSGFQLLGPNHKIVVEVFDDPRVQGLACYLSRAKTGGLSGAIGLAEDVNEVSIACRQVATTMKVKGPLPRQEQVFSEKQSILFKKMRVVRMVDPVRNALVYLTYSDKLVDGSPKSSVTAVPLGDIKVQLAP